MFLYKTYKHKAHAAAGASGKSEGKKNRSCERCFRLEMVWCRVRRCLCEAELLAGGGAEFGAARVGRDGQRMMMLSRSAPTEIYLISRSIALSM